MRTHTPFHSLHSPKTFVFVLGACAAILAAVPSQAQFTTFNETNEVAFNALGPTAVPITGNPPDTYPNAAPPRPTYTTSVGTQTLTIANESSPMFVVERRNQQGGANINDNYGGEFPGGTPLLRNVATNTMTSSLEGLRITFLNPVSAFGFSFDPTLPSAAVDFTFDVFEGGLAPAGTFGSGNDVNSGVAGSGAFFFGVQEGGGNLISSILISGQASATPPQGPNVVNTSPNDFAVGLLRFKISPQAPPPSVPEPGSVALLIGMVATGTGCLVRRKRKFASK